MIVCVLYYNKLQFERMAGHLPRVAGASVGCIKLILLMKYIDRLQQLRQQFSDVLQFRKTSLTPREQYQANLLRVMLYGSSFLLIIFVFIGILGDISERNRLGGFFATLMMTGATLIALWLSRRGKVQSASRLIIATAWVWVALASFSTNGLYSTTMMGMMLLLVVGVLLLSGRAKQVLLLATVAWFFALYAIEVTGNLPPSPFKDLPFRVVALSITALCFYAVVVYHKYAIVEAERKMNAMQLDAERMKIQRELAQDLAHDLRTPLATIRSSAYLLRRRQEKGLPLEKHLAKVEAQIDHVNAMIEELFELTLLDTNKQDPTATFKLVNLYDLARAAVTNAQPQATSRSITLEFTDDRPQKIEALGDPVQLGRIFDNLISNAIRYGCDEGMVVVGVRQADDTIYICVRDDGIGIAPEFHDRIFERFFRVDEENTSEVGGTGIGLNAVQRIVQLHHGTISVESEPGHGTTFRVELPTAEAVKQLYLRQLAEG